MSEQSVSGVIDERFGRDVARAALRGEWTAVTGMLVGAIVTTLTTSPALGGAAGVTAAMALARLSAERSTAMLQRELELLTAEEDEARRLDKLSRALLAGMREELAAGQTALLALLEDLRSGAERDFEQLTRFLQKRFDEVRAGQVQLESKVTASSAAVQEDGVRSRVLRAVDECSGAMDLLANRLHVLGTFVHLVEDPEQEQYEPYPKYIARLQAARFAAVRGPAADFRAAVNRARIYLPVPALAAMDALLELHGRMESGWIRFAVGLNSGSNHLGTTGQMAVLEAEQELEITRRRIQTELRQVVLGGSGLSE